jgi:hypothetical protein
MPLKLMLDLATVEITFCQVKINVVVHKRHPGKVIYTVCVIGKFFLTSIDATNQLLKHDLPS